MISKKHANVSEASVAWVLVQIGMADDLTLSETDWSAVLRFKQPVLYADHCWVGPEAARNRKLVFVNFLRQLDPYDDPTRVIETLEAEHRLQA